MALDPLKVTSEIRDSYIRYLTTAFRLRDPKLQALFHQEAAKFWFTNGPILEATPPFKRGSFLADLVKDRILNEGCGDLFQYLRKNSLYLHQEKAIRKILNGRNLVIASGTGSGKTECFLLPIYNYLLNERKEGRLGPGVRALLLYPMNALANDQLRRLREVARIIEREKPDLGITFGRYVGDTPETKNQGVDKFRLTNPGEEPVRSELLSRAEMRENPPNILITNYAMLEYLLLRPEDSRFFDGEHAKHWKFLVLDEAHIYGGANGIEMGMLVRRLKDRVCDGKEGILQCIATSATLVKEEEDFGKVADFATNLFGEKFESAPDVEDRQDVIKGEKIELQSAEGGLLFGLDLYPALDRTTTDRSDPDQVLQRCYDTCLEHAVPQHLLDEAKKECSPDAKRFLFNLLSRDKRIIQLKSLLESGPTKLERCIEQLAGDEHPSDRVHAAITSLVNLAVWARPEEDSLPLLPARYHLFVRAPEGIFVSFFPEPKIYLERRERTDEGFAVFDLASCRRCGQEYLVGDIVDGTLKHPFAETDLKRKNRYFLLWRGDAELQEDEDEEVAVPEEIAEKGKTWRLCVKCARLTEDRLSCDCDQEKNTLRTVIEINPRDGILNTCYTCGLRSINVVREFIFQQDAPAAVLVTALFQNLEKRDPKEKKILAFSDSRQDAAFFAPYLDYTYRHILYRRLIVEVLSRNKSISDYRLETLCEDVLRLAEEKCLFEPSMDEKQKKREVWGWTLQEFCALDRRNCLEGVGLLSFLMVPPRDWKPLTDLSLPPWSLSEPEAIALYQVLLDTLRFNKAITFPDDGPSPQDEIFARFNRNKEYRLRGEKSDSKKGIYSFISAPGRHNTRLEFLRKLYRKTTGQEDDRNASRDLLSKIWDDLKANWIERGLHQFSDRREGVLFQLDHRYWKTLQENPSLPWSVCNQCGTISPLSVRGICPTFGCRGQLEGSGSSSRREEIERNHYRYLYGHLPLVNMVAEEHTAQLRQDDASNVQQRFIRGEINVLSCSTTFELGVDLGKLETIFMRNVPPEPSNYIQRAGRAGRRLDSVGFTLTFAQLRSHDLTYFKEPEKMVEGRITPPVVEIRNEKIVRRHLHSIVLARFFRRCPEYFGKVDSFFPLEGSGTSGLDKLKEYLESKPADMLQSLKRTIPLGLHDTFALDNWGWIGDFIKRGGSLETADAKIKDEYDSLKEFYETRKDLWISAKDQKTRDRLNADMKWADDRMKTIQGRQLIEFLATNTVIPKYGFPVDVVELTTYSHLAVSKRIQLERDLRIAISEFAPTSQVVAKGYIWESAGLRVVRDRTWPVYWYAICPNCQRYFQSALTGDLPSIISCSGCKKTITRSDVQKFITPIFGFVTSREHEPQRPGESRPKREFSTRPYFFDREAKELGEKDFQIGKIGIKCQYSASGELAVICKGRKGRGFYVCSDCGAAFSERPKGGHKKPIGEECSSAVRGPFHFGHTFKTDVLTISLEKCEFSEALTRGNFWFSLLYALLEGATQGLGIRRQDLDGCLYPREGKMTLVLFDNVPGGAGHVKRIIEDEKNLCVVLNSALGRLKKCTCGPETSCYGCLRNYQNQFCHKQLNRGIILEFLSRNLEQQPR